MINGNGTTSLRKLDLENQKVPALGFQKTVFAHKASAGQTGITLSSLTLPTEMTGFSNPPTVQLTGTNLLFFKNNLTLISSLRGYLIQGLSYSVASSSQLNFIGFTAAEGEVFTGIIDYSAQTGVKVVDARAISATGTLAAGTTDFNVGTPFKVGQYTTSQIGSVFVMLDGVPQFRNTANSSTTLDGNYYEVDAGGGLGAIIRFNVADPDLTRNIMVISNGLLSERPDGSMMAAIENSQGQINNLATYVAALAGQSSTTVLGAAPSNVDLKAFGDRVFAAESNITNLTASVATVTTTATTASTPTSMTDTQATRIGLKQYLHGTTYNGGNAPTVTLSAGGGTLTTVYRAVFVPYQMQDGGWRMRFNATIQLSTATRTQAVFAINGIVFKNVASYTQSCGGGTNNGSVAQAGFALGNTNTLEYDHSSVSSNFYDISGDVELDSKPTWAY